MKSRISGKALEGARRPRAGAKQARRRANTELRFRRLFENAKDGILILDSQTHKILEVNPHLLDLLGYSSEDLIGKDFGEIGFFSDPEASAEAMQILQSGRTVRFEHTWRAAGSTSTRELEFVCNQYDEDGRALIQCNIRDIAERKEGERQLREVFQQLAIAKAELENRVQERTADLQQRNAELEAFSYSLSHDLRAPIRAIVSFTQIALEDYGKKVGPPATELLQKAVSSAQRLDHLILDVLAFSRATRQPVRPELVDVERLLRDILQERPEWNPPQTEILIQSPLLAVYGDRASLTQCLTNLLDNAIKFVPKGQTPRIQVYTQRVGDQIRLCVADNGIGIPLDLQPRIFELFQRAHNGYEGYGIGLAIVRRAADRMHASVGVSSEPGKGSTFWLELPGKQD